MANNCGLRPSRGGTVGSGKPGYGPVGHVAPCADADGDERRSALTSAAVTGEIDVREA